MPKPWGGLARIIAAKERKAKRLAKRKAMAGMLPVSVLGRPTVKILDYLWSFAVKLRDKKVSPICRICGQRPGTVAYHIVTKQRGHSIRWMLTNGVLACAPCNLGEMMNRALYRDKHIALFGAGIVEGIEAIARARVAVDLFFVESALKAEIQSIQGGMIGKARPAAKDEVQVRKGRRARTDGASGGAGGSSEDVPQGS